MPSVIADHVETGDGDPDTVWRRHSDQVALQKAAAGHDPLWHDPFGDDLPVAVDVIEEALECAHPLRDARRHLPPLLGLQDARHQVDLEGVTLALTDPDPALLEQSVHLADQVVALARIPPH
jgi:hypothetical protein